LRSSIFDTGLLIIKEGTFGLPIELFYLLAMYSTYPIKVITRKYPDFLPKDDEKPDPFRRDDQGYTRYALACKNARLENGEPVSGFTRR